MDHCCKGGPGLQMCSAYCYTTARQGHGVVATNETNLGEARKVTDRDVGEDEKAHAHSLLALQL